MIKNYNKLLKMYKGNDEIIDEIDFLQNIDYSFDDFEPGFYTVENVKNYSIQMISNACKLLDNEVLKYGLQNKENLEKVRIYLKYIPYTNQKIIKGLNVNDLKKVVKINKKYSLKDILRSNITNIDDFKKVLNNSKSLNHLISLCQLFNIFYISPDFFTILLEQNFSNFMNILDKSYINNENTLDDLLEVYEKNKSLFANKSLDKDIINNYIFNKDSLSFSLNNDNINEYYELRYNDLKNKCNYMNLYDLRNEICNIIFNTNYSKTIELLDDSKNLVDVSKYKKLNDCDKFDLIKIINDLKYESNISNKIINITKPLSKKKLTESLNIKINQDVIDLKGEDFYTLVHKIKGFDNCHIATELHNNPDVWTKYKDLNSYISASAINQDFSGIVDGNGYILGFHKVKPNDILAMCPMDMLTDKKIVNEDINNLRARYTDPKSLIDKTCMMYNEVVLKRYNNNKPLMPDFVFVKDRIDFKDRDVSSYFKIPIVRLYSEIYADKLMNKYFYYLEKKQFQKASDVLITTVYSFYDSCNVIQKYFNDLQSSIYELQKYIDISNQHELNELLGLVQSYNAVSSIIYESTTKLLDVYTNEVEAKIKKKIQ